MIFLDLFLGFLRVGCFTFGGGYAAIPLIRDVVLDYGWLTEDQLTYMIGVSESTPGPIMVNLATYVGSSQGGILGSLLATLAVVLPSYCIILLILILLKNIIRNPNVKAMLDGMQPCIIGIIVATGVQLSLKACFPHGSMDVRALVIAAILVGIIVFCKKTKRKISPIKLIGISALLGILFYGI
ncbi:MAG: chromate transporter [Oscillospiraceae bacterium]|nr:chromate transporter [Oscillospiraceae bacterium]